MATKVLSLICVFAALTGCNANVDVSERGGCSNLSPAFVALSVADEEQSIAWYRRVFELPNERRIDLGDRGAISILSGDCMTVELLSMNGSIDPMIHLKDSDSRVMIQGIFKTGVFVADIDAAHARLRDLGVDIDERVLEDDAGLRFFNARDPEGNIIQHFQRRDTN